MVSTYTVNLGLEEPGRGDQVGIWDIPENANAALLDLVMGGTTTITLSNSNVTLSAAQYQCRHIVFTGTLTAPVLIIFPTTFRKSYEIENLCTNASTQAVYLTTAVAGSEYILAPPGEIVEIANSGADIRFKNFGRIGEYVDYAGTTLPIWANGGFYGVAASQIWLNCDGSAFSAVTYPVLSNVLGGTTLPDSRGRVRAALNQTTGRLTATGGVNGDTKLAAGGLEYNTLAAAGIPTISGGNPSVQFLSSITTLVRAVGGFVFQKAGASPGTHPLAIVNGGQAQAQPTVSGTLGINSNNTGGAFHTNTQPTFIGGLTLIRAR